MGSGISVEKSSTPCSSNVHTDSQFTHLPSSSSDIESLKREPESDELQKLAPSNSVIESNIPTPLGLGFGGLQTKVMQTAPSIDSGFMLSFFISDLHQSPRFSHGENHSLRLHRPRALTRKTTLLLSRHRLFKISIDCWLGLLSREAWGIRVPS